MKAKGDVSEGIEGFGGVFVMTVIFITDGFLGTETDLCTMPRAMA